MAYHKSIRGDQNQANETGFNHNRIMLNTGAGFTVFAVFSVTLVIAAIIYMWVAHSTILQALIIGTFCGVFGCGWLWLVNFTRRSFVHTSTFIAISRHEREQAWLESRVAVRAEQYVLYLDENDVLQFRGTTQITEHRTFPPQIEAPKEVAEDATILELHDKGLSGQAIFKVLDKKMPYRQIDKILTLYRPGWNKRGKGKIEEEYIDADEDIAL